MPDRPRVILVLFDQLTLPVDSATPCPALDAVELESTYFEQFHVQDVRVGCEPQAVLGDESRIASSLQRLREGDCRCAELRLRREPSTAASPPSLPRGFISPLPQASQEPGVARDELAGLFMADFLLITITGCSGDLTAAEDVLTWLDTIAHSDATLIVTAARGQGPLPGEPFPSEAPAALTHVPLWIRMAARSGSRTQSIAGSNDLLPTIEDLLVRCPSPAADVTDRALSSDPCSLVELCQDPCSASARLIRLTGDGWTALRISEFLLVTLTSDAADVHSASEQESRRLFLKPEDVWNVHDVLTTYPDVADEIEAAGRIG